MAITTPSLLALRKDPRIQRLPPVISALLVIIGVVYFLLLPLDEYSRKTYISENALLPGQVHTYFSGSEQNIFDAYQYEVKALEDKPQEEISKQLRTILESSGLKVATQKYTYRAAGNEYSGENVYAVLHAPRGDATEAIVLVTAWRNLDNEFNLKGVTLALSLARYFKRWSLWSKDIIFLLPSESKAGTQAWVDAYHDGHNPEEVDSLPLKSGALEGALVLDNPLDHKFHRLLVTYDGINGQLPNLDLFNTAVQVCRGQHGIDSVVQKVWGHTGSYMDRLTTMVRGMVGQGLGHASGPHSSFIPYHVDAITLRPVGRGREDDMAMGRVIESLFRSLNNLMEHFHQSFFLYLLMDTKRFVSIGTYLPSAMLVSASFTIMAIALWIASGRQPPASPVSSQTEKKIKKKKSKQFEVVEKDGLTAAIPKEELAVQERQLLYPAGLVLATHFLGILPLYLFNMTPQNLLAPVFFIFAVANFTLPSLLRSIVNMYIPPSVQQRQLTKCFSLLLLGMFLATLATINFSLSFIIGLLSAPLTFVGQSPVPRTTPDASAHKNNAVRIAQFIILQIFSPPVVVYAACTYAGISVEWLLVEAAFGWQVWGLWTQVIVWCVWWPAWMAAALDVAPSVV